MRVAVASSVTDWYLQAEPKCVFMSINEYSPAIKYQYTCTSETCYPMLFYCLMADVSDSISTTALSVTAEPRRKAQHYPMTPGSTSSLKVRLKF